MTGMLRIPRDVIASIVKTVVTTSEEKIAPQSVGMGGSATLKDTGTIPVKYKEEGR